MLYLDVSAVSFGEVFSCKSSLTKHFKLVLDQWPTNNTQTKANTHLLNSGIHKSEVRLDNNSHMLTALVLCYHRSCKFPINLLSQQQWNKNLLMCNYNANLWQLPISQAIRVPGVCYNCMTKLPYVVICCALSDKVMDVDRVPLPNTVCSVFCLH